MKIVHVSHSSRFYENFIQFNSTFDESHENVYFFFGDSSSEFIKDNKRILLYQKNVKSYAFGYIKLIKILIDSDKVILHGLFDPRLLIILNLLPFVLKKCVWFLWGGDLYVYKERRKRRLLEFLRRKVIKNLGFISTYVEGDYLLSKEWYGTRAKYIPSLLYPSNIPPEVQVVDTPKCKKKLTLVVGNSADPQNNHLDILHEISRWKRVVSKIYLPLSYGNAEYAEKVVERFIVTFGKNRIVPIRGYLPKDDYFSILENADIAIYAHKRQQGMGNTIHLLSLGKTIYMRSDVSQWEYFKSIGLQVKDINNVDFECLLLEKEDSNNNKELIIRYHNETKYRQQLDKIYSE